MSNNNGKGLHSEYEGLTAVMRRRYGACYAFRVDPKHADMEHPLFWKMPPRHQATTVPVSKSRLRACSPLLKEARMNTYHQLP